MRTGHNGTDPIPDRPDGGDLARYTRACAAFAELRPPGRSEAWADVLEQAWAAGYDGLDGDGLPAPTRCPVLFGPGPAFTLCRPDTRSSG